MKTKITLMLLLMGSIYGVQAQTFDFSCEPEIEALDINGATFEWDAETTSWYSPQGYSNTWDNIYIYERGSTLNHDHTWVVDRVHSGMRGRLYTGNSYNDARLVIIRLRN